MNQSLSIEILGAKHECIYANSSLWFTQKTIARIFGATKQNVSIYTTELADRSPESISIRFSVSQVEGKRRILRELVHFSIETLAAIAIRSRRHDIYDEVLKAASAHHVPFVGVPILSRKEWDFGELLAGIMRDITPVVEQQRFGTYYADYYLPEYYIVVEFDELYHLNPKQKCLDSTRQAFIEEAFGVTFLRVQYKQEIEEINRILRIVLMRKDSRTALE